MREAQGHGPSQFKVPWPPDDTIGIITTAGRVFHRGTDCPGYQQGIGNARRRGADISPVEEVTAAEARRRRRGVCNRCWAR